MYILSLRNIIQYFSISNRCYALYIYIYIYKWPGIKCDSNTYTGPKEEV